MAFVNKKSLHSEFDSIKSDFERLKKKKMVSFETEMLFKSLIVLFEVMITVFLEKTTKKNSRNSSIPSSQSAKDETSTNTITNGKGKNQNDEVFSQVKTNTDIEKAEVNYCTHCGEDLSGVACCGRERRTKIDIFFEKKVTHVDAEIKNCPTCEGQTKGWFPSDMRGPLQYGNGIKIFLLNLFVAQMVPLKRVQKMMKSIIGLAISEATILKYVLQLHHALESWEQDQIEKLLKSPSMHCDETSMKVNKKNEWIHVYSSGDITLKFIHPKRGIEAIEEIGIIPKYGGVIIHDCWASYLSYGHLEHGLCGSHLLRELTFIVESNNYSWAKNMKKLLKEIAGIVSKRKRKKLTSKEYQNLIKRYRNILTRGKKEMPPVLRKKSTNGQIAKSDAHNLWERFKLYEESVLKFAKVDHVAFTNNRAEQDLRMNKVKQKISGSFRKSIYAQAYCRITSYLKTMSNKGINPMIAIHKVLLNEL